MFPGRPEHLKGFDYVGFHRYHLRFCTHERQPLFSNADVVDLVLRQISRSATENAFAVIAYCFMPDHLHLLIDGQSEASECKRFITRAKQYSGYHYARLRGGVLWQRYGYEHVLRDDERTLVVARCILNNPLRAGLVERVEDYPFVGSLVYTLRDILEAAARLS